MAYPEILPGGEPEVIFTGVDVVGRFPMTQSIVLKLLFKVVKLVLKVDIFAYAEATFELVVVSYPKFTESFVPVPFLRFVSLLLLIFTSLAAIVNRFNGTVFK